MKKRVSAALLSMVLAVGITFFPAKALNPTETYGDFQYRNDGDHITILGYTSTEPDIVFPDYIDGLPVTVIAGAAFNGEDYKGHPETISITLPTTLTLYNEASSSNTKLPNLMAIHISDDNPLYKSIDGALFSKDGKTLVQFPPARKGEYRIPDGVESIGPHSFYYSNLTDVYMPDSVTLVDHNGAMRSKIQNIKFSNNLKIIGHSAFAACQNLKSLELPPSIETVRDQAFGNCQQLEWVHIPGNTEIYAFSFSDCINLKQVIITGDATIGYFCFQNVPNTCCFYVSPTIVIQDWDFDRKDKKFVLKIDPHTQVMYGANWLEKDKPNTFSANRSVKIYSERIRKTLLENGLDDRLLSNIYSVFTASAPKSTDENFPLLFPVSQGSANKPSIYQMDESGKITEANVYWAGNWAIVSEGQEGVYIITQKGAAMGDLDGDGSINIADVMEMCKVLARQAIGENLKKDNIFRSDLDGDNIISISDVMEVCKIMARHTDF